ncbi:hypothetical protein CWB72_16265 [Pseudoalteromonas phenolica]|uniref:hypothetical protein n=1 Tax=Pseudoalteromonas phenolica TaxID=161398 RepID=UPI00110A6EA9|nr:hypothetical protein [Pseudoalteromonas phenolica]TMN87286.1 hypothetical protein CWB72_16265 [Pseudoalteromonas phenolica]
MTLQEYFENYYNTINDGRIDELDHFFSGESPFLNANKRRFQGLKERCEFVLKIADIELIAQQDDLLVVRDFVDCTSSLGGQDMTKRSSNIHALVREGEDWKIHTSSILPHV